MIREDLVSISSLNLSSSYVTSLSGLQFATNLSSLDISNTSMSLSSDLSDLSSSLVQLTMDNAGISAETDFSSLTSLTHLSLRDNSVFTFSSSGLLPASLTSLDVSNTLVIDTSVLPVGLVELSMDDVGLSGDVDFSSFTLLDTLSVVDNTSFTISSSDVFPSSLQSLDISGCTSITDLSLVPTCLTTLSISRMDLDDKSAIGGFSDLLVLNANSSSIDDEDMPYFAELSSIVELYLAWNLLTDISYLNCLSDTLSVLNVDNNSVCGISSSDFPASTTFSYAGQSTSICDQCSDDTGLSFYPTPSVATNTVCKEVWDGMYRTDCAMFSYRDYSSTDALSCVGLTVGTTYTCLSDLESNSNIQCVNEDNGTLEVVSGCVEDWYGDSCNDECPLHNGQQCGGSDFGTCDSTTHTCSCLTGLGGDACENIDNHTLSTFVCSNVDDTDYVTLLDGYDSPCSGYTMIREDLVSISSLNLSSSYVTSLSGLQFATNLSSLDISNTSMSLSSDLSDLSSSLVQLTMDNAGISAETDFSSLTSLTHLSLRDNSVFTFSSSGLLPASLTSLDVSNTLVIDTSVLPVGLVELSMDDVGLSGDVDFSSFTLL
ncbi:hypothetical protein ADUPG1_011380, partial [Aduncisulcus paluster]